MKKLVLLCLFTVVASFSFAAFAQELEIIPKADPKTDVVKSVETVSSQ